MIKIQTRNTCTDKTTTPVVISTRLVKAKRRSFLKGISSICIMSGKSSVLNEYLSGNNYLDMLRDWQCVGQDITTAMEIRIGRYGK